MRLHKLTRTDTKSRFMRYWLNKGITTRAVVVFFNNECRTNKEQDIITSCRNTGEALNKLDTFYGVKL